MSKYQSAEDIDDWILNARAKVMYKDESLVDGILSHFLFHVLGKPLELFQHHFERRTH